jgi:O-antigen/teichoic acid export membrane protein
MRELPEMLLFSIRIVGGRIASGINSQLDTWILGSVAKVVVVGAYSRASGIAVRLNDAGYRVNEILFPALVERFETNDERGFEKLLMDTLRLTALPIALVVGATGGAAEGILDIFGPGFERGAGALAILLLATGLTVMAMVFGSALLAVGKPGWSTILAVVRLATSVAIMYPLARLYGANGVAVAVLLGNVLISVGGTLMLRRVILTTAATRSLFKTIAVSMVVYGVAVGVARTIDAAVTGFLGTLLALVVGAVVAAPFLLLPGGITPEERASALGRVRRLRQG